MKEAQPWQLGQTSAWYETRGRGTGTISVGRGDFGGVSYGEFQLSSTRGTLREYLDQSRYRADFAGLSPATPGFDGKWRELAKEEGFRQDQYDYIKKTHYDRELNALKLHGIDLTNRGPAVQDAIWSTAVQTGTKTLPIFRDGLSEKFGSDYDLKSLTDKDIVGAVQDYKYNHTEALFRHSPTQWHGLKDRALKEKADLLHLTETGVAVDAKSPAREQSARIHGHTHATLEAGAHGAAVYDLQLKLGQLGYTSGDREPLRADGDFGLSTMAAVEAFQVQHNLARDGIVGPKTLQALAEQASLLGREKSSSPQQQEFPLRLDDPSHPDHAFYRQTHLLVCEVDRRHGRTPDQFSDKLTSALVVAGREAGLERIDRIGLGEQAHLMWAAQAMPSGNFPAHRYCRVDTLQALNTPMEQSAAQWTWAMQAYSGQQERAVAQDHPAARAPTMLVPQQR